MLDGMGLVSSAEGRMSARNGIKNKLKLCLTQKKKELYANRKLVIGDIFAAAAAVFAAISLSHGGAVTDELASVMGPMMLLAGVINFVTFTCIGLYRQHSRSTSLRDVMVISRGALLAISTQILIATQIEALAPIPFAVFIIQFLATIPFTGMLRIIARHRELVRRTKQADRIAEQQIPVVLIGTGTNCDLFLRSLDRTCSTYVPVGIIDDATGSTGLHFRNAQILGSIRQPKAAIEAIESCEMRARQLLLTEDVSHFDNKGIFTLLSWATSNGVKISRLPGLADPVLDQVGDNEIKLRAIQPEEILNRPQKAVERSLLRQMIEGRRVLITGAGGSIGSELSRQIASFDPSLLVLLDNCEFNAYSVDMDLGKNYPNVNRQVHVGCIRDAQRVQAVFQRYKPELVFNAAALKHVPMVELNPCEGVLTNVIGTRNVADAARDVRAIAMVQISTDKAVNTTNVMGATKRVAEFYAQAQDRITYQKQGQENATQTRFFSVRFGNVLGSSGSLIPLFQKQISEGGPLTVTDRRMERFFMTIREAVQLTVVAAAKGLARNSGLGEIFVLDMGEPVKIVDLAERMIRMAGLEPYRDIDIDFVGIRPGEKLFEELFDKAEERRDSGIESVDSALPDGVPMAQLRSAIVALETAARAGDEAAVRRQLIDLVPGYGDHADTSQRANVHCIIRHRSSFPAPVAGPERQNGDKSANAQRLWAGE
ncbi:polysaccharide biosynthesis protein [Aliiroseovarius halocynthiae]|uniref:Polysaccharide biosynthesis protein n=2 Tax=Aliiroseovarius halocynthiae TaxID=985055 RepID=A0A545SUK6_9RHOB|nr:polysaccharide biosynthesis protein [Aliiroseovarius halocynthiae]